MNRSVRYAILGLLLMGSLLGLPTEGQAQQKTKHGWLKLAASYKGVDIYGRSVNMADTLRANKRILLYFFTVWDKASYYYHQQHILRNLAQTKDGQAISVWMLEMQGAPRAAIEGKEPYPENSPSQGDWTACDGRQAPYTIISDKNIVEKLGVKAYYLPTTYLVCPSGFYIDCYSALESEKPIDEMKAMSDMCLTEEDSPRDIKIIAPVRKEIGEPCSFSSFARSYSPITSYEWTFEHGTPERSSEAEPSVLWTEAGDYKVTLTVGNKNGKQTSSTTMHIIDCTKGVKSFPFVENFDQDLMIHPDCWHLYDEDGDGINWRCMYQEQLDIPGMPSPSKLKLGRNNSVNCMVSWSSFPTQASFDGGELSFNLIPQSAYNWLILPKISIPSDAPTPTLHYSVMSLSGSDTERYSLFVSEKGYRRADFTHVLASQELAPAGKWASRSVSLAPFVGKDIYIGIKHTDKEKIALLVDNVAVTLDGHYESLSPVPGGDDLSLYQHGAEMYIHFDTYQATRLTVYHSSGSLVYESTHPQSGMSLNVSGWAPGAYIVVLQRDSERALLGKVLIGG